MVYEVLRNLKLCVKKERLSFAKAKRSLFFKSDSCLSNCQVVFSRNPETTTNHFFRETQLTQIFAGVWFCE